MHRTFLSRMHVFFSAVLSRMFWLRVLESYETLSFFSTSEYRRSIVWFGSPRTFGNTHDATRDITIFFYQTASMALLNLSNRSEKMHSKKNVLVKQWVRGCGRSGAVGRDDEMTNFFNIGLLGHVSKIIYEAFHVNCPSARRASLKSCYF